MLSQNTNPQSYKIFILKVLGKYSDDKWLGKGGNRTESDQGEWAVAYHGTLEMNVSGIVKKGFLLEKGKRFLYGRGIYCTPNPRAALDYSEIFHFEVDSMFLK